MPTVREGQYIYKDAAGNVRNEPRQGNAVIAVKDAAGDIMWSYHVWVTDYVPKNYPGYEDSANKDVQVGITWETDASYGRPYVKHFENTHPYKLMKRLLGFVTYGTTVTRDYPENTVYVKLKQAESDLTTVMTVVQLDGQNVLELYRSQPYFQALRKDAFWPGTGLLSDDVDPEWYGKVRTVLNPDGTRNVTTSKMTLDETIKNPSIIYNFTSGSIGHVREWFFGYPTNLWNSSAKWPSTINILHITTDAGLENWRINYFKDHYDFLLGEKTIYDPCPAGYVVPPRRLGFLTTGQGEHSEMDNYLESAVNREDFWSDEDYETALLTADKPIGAWIGDGWAGEDDYNVSIYTDKSHTTYFTLPKTGVRGNGGRGQYVNPSRVPLRLLANTLFTNDDLEDTYTSNVITLLPGSIFSRYVAQCTPTALLPIDDSVGPNPADYPTKEQYESSQGGGSGAPSASSSLGRYTVMRVDSGF